MKILKQEIFENLFIGREDEFFELMDIWRYICKSDREHYAYSLLNTSGIGKTTLLEHFATKIIENNQGLPIRIIASHNNVDFNLYVSNWLNSFRNCVVNNKLFIENYIKTNYKSEIINEKIEEFQEILKNFNKEKNKESYNYNIIPDLINSLSSIIPIFLVIDEVQVWQQIKFMSELNKEETALHCMARSVAQLLNARVLMIFSGTQYAIMSELGGTLGSPLSGKVKYILIHLFSKEEIEEYVKEIDNRLKKYIKEEEKEEYKLCLNSYKEFLLKFSGGHARTIQRITEYFIENLEYLMNLAKEEPENFDKEFIKKFLSVQNIELFTPKFRKEIKEGIENLEKNLKYKIVHDWIIKRSMRSLNLGSADELNDDELISILKELINIGLLALNSNQNYHITSYFYLLEYIKIIEEKDENTKFLKEIIQNKYFIRLCGSHSGFGYVFEEVMLSAILTYSSETIGIKINKELLPFNATKEYEIKKIEGRLDLSKEEIEDNTIYHVREGPLIDYIIRDGDKIILTQITTVSLEKRAARTREIEEKIKGIIEASDELNKNEVIKSKGIKVIGWLISLMEINKEKIKERIEIPEWIRIDDGERLKRILGDKLYDKLISSKISI